MSKFYAEPITCSTKDAMWSMPLPPLLNADNLEFKIEMVTASRFFTFDEERSFVLLNKENRMNLLNGKLCPKLKLIFLEFRLKSEKIEILNQKFAVLIQPVEGDSLQPVEAA